MLATLGIRDAFDYGVKYNILRMLAHRGCKVTVLPAQSTAADALALNPDGIFLSNGPGDPQPCDYAIAASRAYFRQGGEGVSFEDLASQCGFSVDELLSNPK
mgnify:CR=1 FL=1